MLAILANFGDSNPRQVMETLVKEVITTSEGDLSTQRHIRQLQILSQLRNLEPEIVAIMDSIAKIFKKEKDPLYIMGQRDGREEGREEAREQKNHEFVQTLLLNSNYTVSEIASLVKVSEDFVHK